MLRGISSIPVHRQLRGSLKHEARMTKVNVDRLPNIDTTQPTAVLIDPVTRIDKAFIDNKEIERSNKSTAMTKKKKTNPPEDLNDSIKIQANKKVTQKGPKGRNEKQTATNKPKSKTMTNSNTKTANKSIDSVVANTVTVDRKKGSQQPKKPLASAPLEVTEPKTSTNDALSSKESLASKPANTTKQANTAGKKETKATTAKDLTASGSKKKPMKQSFKELALQKNQEKFAEPVDKAVSNKSSAKLVASSGKNTEKVKGSSGAVSVRNTAAPGTDEGIDVSIEIAEVADQNITKTLGKQEDLAVNVSSKQPNKKVESKQENGETKDITAKPTDKPVFLGKKVSTKSKVVSEVRDTSTASNATVANTNELGDEVVTIEGVGDTYDTDTLDTEDDLAASNPTKQPKKQTAKKQGPGNTKGKFTEPPEDAVSDESSEKSVPNDGQNTAKVKGVSAAVTIGTTIDPDNDKVSDDTNSVEVHEDINTTETMNQRENPISSTPPKHPKKQVANKQGVGKTEMKSSETVDDAVSINSETRVPSRGKNTGKSKESSVIVLVGNATTVDLGEESEDSMTFDEMVDNTLTGPSKHKKQVTTKQESEETNDSTANPIDEAVSEISASSKVNLAEQGNGTPNAVIDNNVEAVNTNGQSDELVIIEDVADMNVTEALETEEDLAASNPAKQVIKKIVIQQGMGNSETNSSETVDNAVSDEISDEFLPPKGKKVKNANTNITASDAIDPDIDKLIEDTFSLEAVEDMNITETMDKRQNPDASSVTKQQKEQVVTEKGRGNPYGVNTEQGAEVVSDSLEKTAPSRGKNASVVTALNKSVSGQTDVQGDTHNATEVFHSNLNKTNASVAMDVSELTGDSSESTGENGGNNLSSKTIKTDTTPEEIPETSEIIAVVKNDDFSNSSSLSNEVDLTETEAEMVDELLEKFNVSQSEAFGNETITIISNPKPQGSLQQVAVSKDTTKSNIPPKPEKNSTNSNVASTMEQYNLTMQYVDSYITTNVTNTTQVEPIEDDVVAAGSVLTGDSIKVTPLKSKHSNFTENKTSIDINGGFEEDPEIINSDEGTNAGDQLDSVDEKVKSAEFVDNTEGGDHGDNSTLTPDMNEEDTTTNSSNVTKNTMSQSSIAKKPLVEPPADDVVDGEDSSDRNTWNTTDMNTGNLFSGTGSTDDDMPEVKVGNSTPTENAGVEEIESTTPNATFDESKSEVTDDSADSDTENGTSDLAGSEVKKTVAGIGGSSNPVDTIGDEIGDDENPTKDVSDNLNALSGDSKDSTGIVDSQSEIGNFEAKAVSVAGNDTLPAPVNTDLTHPMTANNAISIGESSTSNDMDPTVVSSKGDSNTAESHGGNKIVEGDEVGDDESESGSTSGLSPEVVDESNQTVDMKTSGSSTATGEGSTNILPTVGSTETSMFHEENEEDDEYPDEDGENEVSTETDNVGDIFDGISPPSTSTSLPVTPPSPKLDVPSPVDAVVSMTSSSTPTPAPTLLPISSMSPEGSTSISSKSLPVINATDDDVSFGSGGLLTVVVLALLGAVFLWIVRNRSKLTFANHRQGYQRLEYKQGANISKKN